MENAVIHRIVTLSSKVASTHLAPNAEMAEVVLKTGVEAEIWRHACLRYPWQLAEILEDSLACFSRREKRYRERTTAFQVATKGGMRRRRRTVA